MSRDWRLIYTKPRAEIKLAKKLAELGFETYCPTRKTVRQWSDRKKKVEEPLFTSYVFIQIEPHETEKVVWVPGFSRFVYWLGKPVMVRHREIEATKDFLDKVAHNTIAIEKFEIGQQVKVVSGALKAQKGTILQMTKKKAVLQIQSMGTTVKAALALDDLIA